MTSGFVAQDKRLLFNPKMLPIVLHSKVIVKNERKKIAIII